MSHAEFATRNSRHDRAATWKRFARAFQKNRRQMVGGAHDVTLRRVGDTMPRLTWFEQFVPTLPPLVRVAQDPRLELPDHWGQTTNQAARLVARLGSTGSSAHDNGVPDTGYTGSSTG